MHSNFDILAKSPMKFVRVTFEFEMYCALYCLDTKHRLISLSFRILVLHFIYFSRTHVNVNLLQPLVGRTPCMPNYYQVLNIELSGTTFLFAVKVVPRPINPSPTHILPC